MTGERLSLCWKDHHSSLSMIIQTLLQSNVFVDCTLAADGKYLKAHKIILSACSSYFQLLFKQESEKNPIVFFKDIKYEHLKLIVDFIYRGEVQVCENQLGVFLEVAKSLQVKGLAATSEEHYSQTTPNSEDVKAISSDQISQKQEVSVVSDDDSDCIEFIDDDDDDDDKQTLNSVHSLQQDQVDDTTSRVTIESTYSMAPSLNQEPPSEVEAAFQQWCPSLEPALEPPRSPLKSEYSDDPVVIDHQYNSENVPENENINGTNDNTQLSNEENCSRRSSCSERSGSPVNNANISPVVDELPSKCTSNLDSGSSQYSSKGVGLQDFRLLPTVRLQRLETSLPIRPGNSPKPREKRRRRVGGAGEAMCTGCETSHPPPAATERPLTTRAAANNEDESTPAVPSSSRPSSSSVVRHSNRLPEKRRRLPLPKRYKCKVCQKGFGRPNEVIIHMRRHTGERPFQCPHCARSFTQGSDLTRHSRVHTGDLPFTCSMCNKGYSRKNTLKIHMRLHTGEKPYQCQVCGKKFPALSQLWSHRKVHLKGKYKCELCGQHFKRKPDLQLHLFNDHKCKDPEIYMELL